MGIQSHIASSTRDTITIRGYDLVDELVGHRDFVDVAILEMTGAFPTPEAKHLVNAILVTVAEHGLTPSVLAARMTYYTAPEALQGAVAAGLLGAGNVLLGSMQNAGELLKGKVELAGLDANSSAETYSTAALELIKHYQDTGRRIPGFGHPIHTKGDPRSAKLFDLARTHGLYGANCRLAEMIACAAHNHYGKDLPLNAAGAIGALTVDMGYPPIVAKALALMARTAGLAAHLMEEQQAPIAKAVWASVDSSVV